MHQTRAALFLMLLAALNLVGCSSDQGAASCAPAEGARWYVSYAYAAGGYGSAFVCAPASPSDAARPRNIEEVINQAQRHAFNGMPIVVLGVHPADSHGEAKATPQVHSPAVAHQEQGSAPTNHASTQDASESGRAASAPTHADTGAGTPTP